MGCWTIDGKEVWTRKWTPTLGRPFNKQFEPVKFGNILLNVEPRDANDPLRRQDAWNYLRAFDARNGQSLWIAPDGLTHYNTPVMGVLPNDSLCILSGRGAHHDTPESPPGLTMTQLAGDKSGSTIWRWDAREDGKAQVTQCWDAKFAYWLDETRTDLVVLDSMTGQEEKRISWIDDVTVTSYNATTEEFTTRRGVNLHAERPAVSVFPAWHANLNVYPHVYFQCFNFSGKRRGRMMNIGPANSIARINVETESVEYLQLPFPVPEVDGQTITNGETYYPEMTVNSRGIDVAGDKRSRRTGWWWCFNGNTIAVNQYLYFTFMCGRVQVLNGQTKHFDQSALVSLNDLGAFGHTWSVNTPSYSRGRLYHRTMKELLCIENQ